MSRQLCFTNDNVNYHMVKAESYIYVESMVKNNNLKSVTITYQYKNHVTTTLDKFILSPFNLAVNNKNNHFIDGYMTYISLFFLLEKTNFATYLPFEFYVPCQLSQGDCSDHTILQYLYSPLKLMLKLHFKEHGKNLIYHYLNTITYFIETYKHLFHLGPPLNPSLINELSLTMMNAIISKKPSTCDVCQHQYKNGLIKCLKCHHISTLNDGINCDDCHRQYNNHDCKGIKDPCLAGIEDPRLINPLINDIKRLEDKLEALTQELSSLTSTNSNMSLKKHKHKKRITLYQTNN